MKKLDRCENKDYNKGYEEGYKSAREDAINMLEQFFSDIHKSNCYIDCSDDCISCKKYIKFKNRFIKQQGEKQ